MAEGLFAGNALYCLPLSSLMFARYRVSALANLSEGTQVFEYFKLSKLVLKKKFYNIYNLVRRYINFISVLLTCCQEKR
jgi:hypothetical protein